MTWTLETNPSEGLTVEDNSKTFKEDIPNNLQGQPAWFIPSHIIGATIDETIEIWPNKVTVGVASSALIYENMTWVDNIINDGGRFRFMTGPSLSSGSYSGTWPSTLEWVEILAAYRKPSDADPSVQSIYFVLDLPTADTGDSGVFTSTFFIAQEELSGWTSEAVDMTGDDVISLKENEIYVPEAWNNNLRDFNRHKFNWGHDFQNLLRKERGGDELAEGFVVEIN